jgi:hypothetical protein
MKFKGYLAATGSVAYRGYLIERNTFTGTYMIRKNGAHIAWAPTVEKARDIIDNLGRALARFCTCDEGRDICRSCAGGI